MFALIKGLFLLAGGAVAVYFVRKLLKRLDLIPNALNKASDYVANIPVRISDATQAAADAVIEQSKKTSRERRGDNHFGSGLDVKAQRNAEQAREERTRVQQSTPAAERRKRLEEQLKTAKANNAAGIFDNGLFVPIADLERELAAT